jgi:hypothetical protein
VYCQFLPSTSRVTVIEVVEEVVEEVDIVDRQVGEVVFRDTRLLQYSPFAILAFRLRCS